jgi:hypothetical protein
MNTSKMVCQLETYLKQTRSQQGVIGKFVISLFRQPKCGDLVALACSLQPA